MCDDIRFRIFVLTFGELRRFREFSPKMADLSNTDDRSALFRQLTAWPLVWQALTPCLWLVLL